MAASLFQISFTKVSVFNLALPVMSKGINVFSTFDGMACGLITLKRLGIKVNKYYASEIEGIPVKFTQKKHPEIIHLGDVTKISAHDLEPIDLLLGGSPCQGFSFAGRGLNFNDPRSKLFFEYNRLLNECRARNPSLKFILENVRMKKGSEDVISRYMEIQPLLINSALVSAQNRERLYWTNIAMGKQGLFGDNVCTIPQPKDKGLYLRDILQDNVDEKYYLSDKMLKYLLGRNDGFIKDGQANFKTGDDKSGCFTVAGNSGGLHSQMDVIVEPICVAMRGRYNEEGKAVQQLEFNRDGKTNTLTSVGKDNLVIERKIIQLNPSDESGGVQPYQQNRIYDINGISPSISVGNGQSGIPNILVNARLRRLTPIEVCRLQTVPDDYFFDVNGGGGN